MRDEIRDHGNRMRTGVDDALRALDRDAGDADERYIPDPRPPLAEPVEALWLPGHHLELGFVDRAERDVVRPGGKRGVEFGFVMGRDAELDVGGPDRIKVSGGKVLLAEVQKVGAGLDRKLPVVVDDQLTACLLYTSDAADEHRDV